MSPFRVLTVCTGNVCRSPAAAVMLREAILEAGLADRIEVGSAGTSWEAEGMPMDERTELALIRAGYTRPFEHTAQTIHLTELLTWDLVLPMTIEHAQLLRRMAEQAPEGKDAPEIALWRRFDPKTSAETPETEIAVDDPWYEGQGAFNRTVVQMQRSLPAIIAHVQDALSAR
ncbi:MAG: protein tyrosine phosphatase [Brachybacterium tyrofermentans]|uniref:protein-tyrosine-phosphatase n=1 Tax=Brachybacterium tyrofermentans TaxID=47848 RepID=A0ABW0FG06_9MICO|nr:protein tyrosine phosphatase [Brachybacterium tyrofermentans]SLN05409.1 Low molecular weight protein tyrosine phosphatase [Corynebacterium xerosis]